MKEAFLEKIKELEARRYYQAGEIYKVLDELKKFIKEYEI